MEERPFVTVFFSQVLHSSSSKAADAILPVSNLKKGGLHPFSILLININTLQLKNWTRRARSTQQHQMTLRVTSAFVKQKIQ